MSKPAARKAKIKPVRVTVTLEEDADQHLFAALKAQRMALAKAQNVPPYVIFHDKTLRELALQRPSDYEQMRTIPGIGEQKFQRYGRIFLDVIAQHAMAG